jgi:ADP-ribose pyrophosphatase
MESDAYRRKGHREIYRNPWLAAEVHEIVHPTGAPGEHLLVVVPSASVAIVEDAGELIFTRQPRFAARRRVIEIVKGGREPGETALACAQRELREELGYVAGAWTALGSIYEIPSIVSPAVELFVARDLSPSVAAPEFTEAIEAVRMTFAAAVAAVAGGELDDAVTLAALFRYGVVTGLLSTSDARSRSGN